MSPNRKTVSHQSILDSNEALSQIGSISLLDHENHERFSEVFVSESESEYSDINSPFLTPHCSISNLQKLRE